MLSVVVLLTVFALIAVRRVGGVNLGIWQVMSGGALICLLTRQISVSDAFNAINLDVMVFLFGMFVVGQALEESGYLGHLCFGFFKRARSIDELILYILFGMGFMSAVLMNDTLAVVGTPAVLLLSRKHRISPKLLLLSLAFAVTIGSVASPIGNPQNLLIAIDGGVKNPFVTFIAHLFVPTVINLLLAYLVLRMLFKGQFHGGILDHSQEPINDKRLAYLSKISLLLIVCLIAFKIFSVSAGLNLDFRLTYIAFAGMLPILIFSEKRAGLVSRIDWQTLVFFASMFVLMRSVWDSGFIQGALALSDADITAVPVILAVSILLSQLVSNVPLVALYQPLLIHAGASTRELIALAAGSTIAGNLFILGAASNVIIIQNAERKTGETITFVEFARIGLPLTLLNALVYMAFLW